MPQTTPRQRLPQLVLSTGILTALIVTTYFMTSISKVNSATLQWLHVEGNRIVDESGKAVVLRGVNIENREWIWNDGTSIAFERRAIPKATDDPPNGWGANIVTLAVASGPVNRGDRTYLSSLDELVALAKSHGAYTFLVYRYAEPDTDQPIMPDQAAQDAMAALARRYASEPAVLYGLQVEPHDVSWSELKPRFTAMVDAIRADNPRALIAVPGTQWGRYIHWALSSPIPRDNLIYKSHYYDPYSLIDSQYQLSSVAAVYPVILGEFGAGPSTSLSEVQQLLTRAETLGISWVGWLFHAKGCPCMLSDSSTFATTEYGAEVKKRLQAAATPVPVPSPTPEATVYDDTQHWADWSWGTTINPNVFSPVFAGTKSLAVTYTSAWASLSLHTPSFNTSPYSHLSFAIRPNGEALPNLRVSLFGTVGGPIKQLELQPYVFPATNGWHRIFIPLTDLGGANTTIRRVQLQDFSGSPQPTFYVDDLKFLTNQPPSVNAGQDQTVTLQSSATVNLDGTVSDDSLPNPLGAVTTTWSKLSGPGTVTFANANAVQTTASLSQSGAYVLRLAASDSQFSASDALTITVLPAPLPASDAVVYDETLHWADWSWGTTINPNVSSPVFAGTKSLAVTLSAPWAGLSLHTSGFDTSPFSHLQFAIFPGGQSFPKVDVSLYTSADQLIKELDAEAYATAAGNGWYRISIPLADLGGSDITVTRVQLQEGSGRARPTFYLDDFRFSS